MGSLAAAVSMLLLLLAVVAVVRTRPKAFVVRPAVPAFNAPPQPAFVLMALAFLPLATGMFDFVIRAWTTEPFLLDQLLGLGGAAMLMVWFVSAWRDTSVQLRPDGLWQRGITGWLIVPWDASPTVPTLPPAPYADTVRLSYGRPDLVRRHGLHVYRRRLRTQDIDPRLITAAIRYYVDHPEYRPAIGTKAEYDRVMPGLLNALDWSPALVDGSSTRPPSPGPMA